MLKAASFALAVLVAAPVLAHPKLVTSVPAANATVAAPALVSMSFNERIVPRFSGATVTMVPPAGAAQPVTGLATSFGADGKSILLKGPHALKAGSYKVAWHAVATDTHRVAGSFMFKVR